MNQNFKHTYQDDFIEVTLEAHNDGRLWANTQDLTKALLDIVKCTNGWKKFELYVVVKREKKSRDDWQLDPDLA